jgi:hypothetical protein
MLKKEVCGAGGGENPPPAPKTYFIDRLIAAFSMRSATAFGCET